ncbi:hypothetical protein ACBQ21_13270 [Pseudomonas putida]|uniref:hypothetical protein n=1 Tax=Pseudomonas putida TaxID=303 RepID=UPI003524B54A
MSVVVKYQVSLFVPFQPFTAGPESFKNAFEVFFPRGFFPSTVQEQGPGGVVAERLALTNNTLGINVQFLSNRIDFLAMPFASPQANLTLERFVEEVRALIGSVLGVHRLRVERLALMTERMIDNLQADALEDARKRFINSGIDEYEAAANVEWSIRQVVRTPLSQDFGVVCNRIYSLSKGTVQLGDVTGVRSFEAIQIALDINTLPLPGQEFDMEGIQLFLSHVLPSHNVLLEKIEKRIHGH